MTLGLKRYQQSKQPHFVTFSCHKRMQGFRRGELKDIFLSSLEQTRQRYHFRVYGYVVMPEHVHLLISEPRIALISVAIQALKVSVARKAMKYGASPFWQKRYYDHNVRDHESFVEKLRYIHRNPVKRGLCSKPQDWAWSSFGHYSSAEKVLLRLNRIGRHCGEQVASLSYWNFRGSESQNTHICQNRADVGHRRILE